MFASTTNAHKSMGACTHIDTYISSKFKRKIGEIFLDKEENIV